MTLHGPFMTLHGLAWGSRGPRMRSSAARRRLPPSAPPPGADPGGGRCELHAQPAPRPLRHQGRQHPAQNRRHAPARLHPQGAAVRGGALVRRAPGRSQARDRSRATLCVHGPAAPHPLIIHALTSSSALQTLQLADFGLVKILRDEYIRNRWGGKALADVLVPRPPASARRCRRHLRLQHPLASSPPAPSCSTRPYAPPPPRAPSKERLRHRDPPRARAARRRLQDHHRRRHLGVRGAWGSRTQPSNRPGNPCIALAWHLHGAVTACACAHAPPTAACPLPRPQNPKPYARSSSLSATPAEAIPTPASAGGPPRGGRWMQGLRRAHWARPGVPRHLPPADASSVPLSRPANCSPFARAPPNPQGGHHHSPARQQPEAQLPAGHAQGARHARGRLLRARPHGAAVARGDLGGAVEAPGRPRGVPARHASRQRGGACGCGGAVAGGHAAPPQRGASAPAVTRAASCPPPPYAWAPAGHRSRGAHYDSFAPPTSGQPRLPAAAGRRSWRACRAVTRAFLIPSSRPCPFPPAGRLPSPAAAARAGARPWLPWARARSRSLLMGNPPLRPRPHRLDCI
jgi:hypothetical protein